MVHDRGTISGLQPGRRIGSVLMSLQPLVRPEYDFKAESGSPEARLYADLLRPSS